MDLSTECIRAFWKKGDQQDMNDEEIVLELIKVQVTQEKNTLLSGRNVQR